MEISQYTWHWQTGLFQETSGSPHYITLYCAVSEMRKYDGGGWEDLHQQYTGDEEQNGHKNQVQSAVFWLFIYLWLHGGSSKFAKYNFSQHFMQLFLFKIEILIRRRKKTHHINYVSLKVGQSWCFRAGPRKLNIINFKGDKMVSDLN